MRKDRTIHEIAIATKTNETSYKLNKKVNYKKVNYQSRQNIKSKLVLPF